MLIYKIADEAGWRAALALGHYVGSQDDQRDGFVHLSTAAQTPETVAKHFSGRRDLVIAAVDADRLGANLRWEKSRGGALFPHCYGPLPIAAVAWWRQLPLGADGAHAFPSDFAGEIA
jgi:uncharacterized protein (DUF952 family)